MKKEVFDFYDRTSLKSYNLDKTMQDQLNALGSLDVFTRKHCENVAAITCRLCEYLHCSKGFTEYCTICAYLHDIGKIFIPASVLQKPGKLTDEEYAIIKTHTTIGYEMCMKDPKLQPYAAGPWYHHEALNGTGYPRGLTKKDIPYEGQIIRVADEYDALVTKRHYKTHVNISETLKLMLKDAKPDDMHKVVALDQLSENAQSGKISPKILKCLFKIVIEDTKYEISCVIDYIDYLKESIKRLELIDSYNMKMQNATKQKKRDYYKEGMVMLFQAGENFQNYHQILKEYRAALVIREKRIDDLYNEIKIIKKLKV